MLEIGARARTQPAPPRVLFEALEQPHRDPSRPWLELLDDEVELVVVEVLEPQLLVWSSLWVARSDARVRFEVTAAGAGSRLRWVLLVEGPEPEAPLLGHLRKRLNELINANLRYSFGQ